MTPEDANLMRAAANEIAALRRGNEMLAVRIETFEKCFAMVNAQHPQHPQQPQAPQGPDLVYIMAKRAQEIDSTIAAQTKRDDPSEGIAATDNDPGPLLPGLGGAAQSVDVPPDTHTVP